MMKTITTTIVVLFILFIFSLFPKGYEIGKDVLNGKLHNNMYCAIYDLMDKHETTKPGKEAMGSYLSKCMIEHKAKKQIQIEEYLIENKEELKKNTKKQEFNLKK